MMLMVCVVLLVMSQQLAHAITKPPPMKNSEFLERAMLTSNDSSVKDMMTSFQEMSRQPNFESHLQDIREKLDQLEQEDLATIRTNLTAENPTNSTAPTDVQVPIATSTPEGFSDPWLEDEDGTSSSTPRTSHEQLASGKPVSPSSPMAPAAMMPANMPPLILIMCDLFCLGAAYRTCMRPCSYAMGCGQRTISDQNIMEKLLPKMLELRSETRDIPTDSEREAMLWHWTVANATESSPTVPDAFSIGTDTWINSFVAESGAAGEITLSDLRNLPFSNQTQATLKAMMHDDLCQHNVELCVVRDMIGTDSTVTMLQTWMSSRLHSKLQTGVGTELATRARTSTGFVLSLLSWAVKSYCRLMQFWPPSQTAGFCGWYCNYGKSEECIQICLNDMACCSLWHCLERKGNGRSALATCAKESCWTTTIGCDHNIIPMLKGSNLYKMVQGPYDQVETKTGYDPLKLFPFWRPPYRLDGKSLGAIGLARFDLYPQRDIPFMGGGIGFHGQKMGHAVYGY